MTKKVAYVINHISFFTSHILPLAISAKESGYDIKVFCGYGGSRETEVEAKKILKKNKINFINVGFSPASKNIFNEVKFLIKFLRELKKYNPDIVHGISLKGILYSCIYSNIFSVKKLICFITGMGYFFTNKLKFNDLVIKKIILFIIKITLKSKNNLLILENNTDKIFFVKEMGIDKSKIKKLNGAGVDLEKFNSKNNKKKKSCFISSKSISGKRN